METRVENYIADIEVSKELKCKGISDVNKFISVCKRVNNSKRDFLFVNKLQGKHVDVNPSDALNLFSILGKKVYNKVYSDNNTYSVIGFAETATAIGMHIACMLKGYSLQTTRSRLVGIEPTIEFREEHSHAAEHNLYIYDLNKFKSSDYIIFCEDEISTGKTILNTVKEMRKKGLLCNQRVVVASILNWQNDEDRDKFEQANIDVVYLVRGKLKESIKHIEYSGVNDVINCVYEDTPDVEVIKSKNKYRNMYKNLAFRGAVMYDYAMSCIEDARVIQGVLLKKPNVKKVLVIGTEEFMYIPLVIADYLSYIGFDVKFKATTRSPIQASNESIIKQGYKFKSMSTGADNYIYDTSIGNKDEYDSIVVITDTIQENKIEDKVESVINMFKGKNIVMYTM